MEIEKLHKIFLENPSICTDTRAIGHNSLFFALKGERFDANDFAADALKKGSKYAIVDRQDVAINEKYILVDNVLQTLQQLANYHRKYCKAKILGITGTNGKTTTKEFINAVLTKKYKVIATEGNLNNHIGVPLTLLRLTPETEIGIVEMGANHPNEIAELCEIAEPDYGIISNIGTAHIEGFGSVEGIFKTKTALYEAVARKKGTIFVNADDEMLFQKANELCQSVHSYGTEKGESKGKLGNPSLLLQIVLDGAKVQTQLFGIFNLPNILAAYAIGSYFDVPKEAILEATANYIPQNNRSQIYKTSKNLLILDAYNANPTSMEISILSFEYIEGLNKHLILGDMLELGHLSEKYHQRIKDLLQELHLEEKTWLVGQNFSKNKVGRFSYFETTENVMEYLQQNPLEKKQILIKGSRGIKLENLVKML